ncbi:hypothetical protein JW998_00415 [candidate division KSB1 bacterium]|nr:hypothetical protein [candidate division KSB1 bacterium]
MPLMKLARPREFKIETYYYNQDAAADQEHRIHFRRLRHSQRVARVNPVQLLFAILLLLFAIYYLHKKTDVLQDPAETGKIRVEEIIIVD